MASYCPNRSTPQADIAVIGMACRFPGADDTREFWNNLRQGVCSIVEVPADRWDWRTYDGNAGSESQRSISRWGGFLRNVDRFDAEFFGISPREATWIDPQQRQALELCWHCLEDAGYKPGALSGASIGVYIGACNFDYKTLQERHCATVEGHIATGNANAIIPNRVSYFFNFHGPSVAVDTACSSSLVALQQAVSALRAGECEAALVGGVGLLATPDRYLSFSAVGMLSPTGACRSFDAAADGYVRAEGAGFVMLKPLARAQADGDHVLGVIKGIAVNHGGRARSLTAPNALSQAQVIAAAMRDANVDPETIGYVETHGTGTPLGDPIEVLGLVRAFQHRSRPDGERKIAHCALGALKANIGHLESSAGIAGVIKVLLAMRHRQIPGHPRFERLNPRIQLDDSPFYIAERLHEWAAAADADGRALPRRAGVSSFGFGGVNSHVVLEEAPPSPSSAPLPSHERSLHVLALSARTDTSLRKLAGQFADRLADQPERLDATCRRYNTTHSVMTRRLALSARSAEEMVERLQQAARAEVNEHAGRNTPRIGFLFTGQGSQYAGMGCLLYEVSPIFRSAFDRCDALLAPRLGQSVHSLVFGEHRTCLDHTRNTQPALFALQIALVEWWRACGIEPHAVMGHSVGEVAAACVAGVLSLEDAALLIAERGRLMQSHTPPGVMATVFAPATDVVACINAHSLPVAVAALNAADATVISGDHSAVSDTLQLLGRKGIASKLLQVGHAFHSDLMNGMQAAFREAIDGLHFHAPKRDVISNVSGERLSRDQLNAQYWIDHVRAPVQFHRGLLSMQSLGMDVLIEIGPSATLLKLARRTLGDSVHLLPSLDPERPVLDTLSDTLAQLHASGAQVNFEPLYPQGARPWVELPPYPFDGERYWVAPTSVQPFTGASNAPTTHNVQPLLGHRMEVAGDAAVRYASTLDLQDPAIAAFTDHRVAGTALMPGAAFVSLALAAASQQGVSHGDLPALEELRFLQPLVLRSGTRLQTVLQPSGRSGELHFQVWSAPAGDTPVWALHATGRICTPPPAHDDSRPEPGTPSGEDQATTTFYANWSERGVEYGPAFQGLQRVCVSADACIAEVRRTTIADTLIVCPPALLDAIWQSALPLLPDSVLRQGLLPLPAGVNRVEIHAPWPDTLTVTTRRAATDEPDLHKFDCEARASNGRIVARIGGLMVRPVSRLPNDNESCSTGQTLPCYRPAWRRVQPPAIQSAFDTPKDDRHILIVYTADSAPLAARLTLALGPRRTVCLGLDVTHAMFEGFHAPTDDRQALAAIVDRLPAWRSLYFLAALELGDAHGDADERRAACQRAQARGVFTLLELLQRMDRMASAPMLRVVVNRTQAVRADDAVLPWGAAAIGLASVRAHEQATAATACIDLDLPAAPSPEHWDERARQVLAEPAIPGGGLIAYRDGWRYARRLQRVELKAAAPVFRQQGVYLIVGGAGGIGMVLSRHLARQHAARLVWVGRGPLDAARQALMDEVQALGGEVLYEQADVCDATSLRDIVCRAVQRFGPLHGVVHAALNLNDRSIANLDAASFRATFDGKAFGSLALYQAVQDQPLDFLALFSSAVSLLAPRGQANYVAGSAVQDAFAHHLRQRGMPACVFDWGRWGSVGAVASEEFTERLDAQGIRAIDPDEGVALIEAALASGLAQLVPVRADGPVLDAIGVDPHSVERSVPCASAVEPVPLLRQTGRPAQSLAKVPASDELAAGYASLDEQARRHVLAAFDALRPVFADPAGATARQLADQVGIADEHRRCFDALLRMLQRDGSLQCSGERWRPIGATPRTHSHETLQARHVALLTQHPWLAPELRLLHHCGPALADVLRGRVAGTSVLFPELSMERVEPVYAAGPLAQACNDRVARIVVDAVHAAATRAPGHKLRVLEIGAGTGGTTRRVLEQLDPLLQREAVSLDYLYTDISSAFLHHGQSQFAEGRPFLRFETLNIEDDPAPQGFDTGGHDIVIAANVLHATRDLGRTLQNVKQLLSRGGLLLLAEAVQPHDFLTVTFGLLPGWWLAQDGDKRVSDAPLLTPQLWQAVLEEEGFRGVTCWPPQVNWTQGVITAVSDGHYRVAQVSAPSPMPSAKPTAQQVGARRTTAADVLAAPPGSAAGALQPTLTAYLQAELVEVLQLRAGAFQQTGRPWVDLYLSELGLDSLTAMDLRHRLQRQLALDIPMETLLGGTRIEALLTLMNEQLLVRRVAGAHPAAAEVGSDDMETFTL